MTETERAEYMKRKSSVDVHPDPIRRMVRDFTAEEMVEWMQFRGSLEKFDQCIADNLREQFKWHRLQGRIDRHPLLIVIAELWGLRRKPKTLERPKDGQVSR